MPFSERWNRAPWLFIQPVQVAEALGRIGSDASDGDSRTRPIPLDARLPLDDDGVGVVSMVGLFG